MNYKPADRQLAELAPRKIMKQASLSEKQILDSAVSEMRPILLQVS